jgi:hypothetical protein
MPTTGACPRARGRHCGRFEPVNGRMYMACRRDGYDDWGETRFAG